MIDTEVYEIARQCLDEFRQRQATIATAESCTGGLIGAALTAVPGSSDVVERGFITYSNLAKAEVLGVPEDMIAKLGAVSAQVAAMMAAGALRSSSASHAVAVTGVAGPGASEAKPAGLVFIGVAVRGYPVQTIEYHFDGDRQSVRHQTVLAALEHLTKAVQDPSRPI